MNTTRRKFWGSHNFFFILNWMILCPAPVFFVKLFVPNVEIFNIFCEFFLEYKSDSAVFESKEWFSNIFTCIPSFYTCTIPLLGKYKLFPEYFNCNTVFLQYKYSLGRNFLEFCSTFLKIVKIYKSLTTKSFCKTRF